MFTNFFQKFIAYTLLSSIIGWIARCGTPCDRSFFAFFNYYNISGYFFLKSLSLFNEDKNIPIETRLTGAVRCAYFQASLLLYKWYETMQHSLIFNSAATPDWWYCMIIDASILYSLIIFLSWCMIRSGGGGEFLLFWW